MPVPSGAVHLWIEWDTHAVCGQRESPVRRCSRRIEKVTCKRCRATKKFANYALGAALVAAHVSKTTGAGMSLTPGESRVLAEALLNPPAPNAALRRAASH